MKTIETTAEIDPDRRLVIDLPIDVPAGRRHVVLVIGELQESESIDSETGAGAEPQVPPLRWDGTLLVYDGELVGPCEDVLDEVREERIRGFFPKHES